MKRILVYLVAISLVNTLAILMNPAYADVNSFQTDKSFYIPGNKIYFTGTVGINDYQKPVTLVIHDPTGKFILILGNYSDSIYTFKMTINTNDQAQFSTKGTYSATAFVESPSTGETIKFDFSPDGLPVIHAPNANETETNNPTSTTLQHFHSQVNENMATNDLAGNPQKIQTTTPSSSEKPTSQLSPSTILYPLISLCGVGIVAGVLFMKRRRKSTLAVQEHSVTTQTDDEQMDDYALTVLKNRLAKGEINLEEFNAIKNVLAEP